MERYIEPMDKLTLAAYARDKVTLAYIAQEQGYYTDKGLEAGRLYPVSRGGTATGPVLYGHKRTTTPDKETVDG